MSGRPRVLVVDDSAFARKVLREILADDERIDVVGFARDGFDALEKIDELAPDVVTLDLVMPVLDGVGLLEALRSRPKAPRVVVVTMSDADSPRALEALRAGAFDLVHKPTALATDRLYELRDELVAKVLAAADGRLPPAVSMRPMAVTSAAEVHTRLLVIATSTGGPRALTLLLGALPASFAVPIVAVVHMPAGFTHGLAQRLDSDCALSVHEAEDGRVFGPGTVAIGRAGQHLRVQKVPGGCQTIVGGGPFDALHRPSADVLFDSAAAAFGDTVLGVVLTGMGSDGLAGAGAIRGAGGRLLVEAASSCVVFGMPRVVAEAGLADAVVALEDMASAIATRL